MDWEIPFYGLGYILAIINNNINHEEESNMILKGAEMVRSQLLLSQKQHQSHRNHYHRRSISSISIDILPSNNVNVNNNIADNIANNNEMKSDLDILKDIQSFQQCHASNNQQQQHALSYLDKDEAYKYARSAGLVWQSIVGEFVRFPKEWFGGESRVPLDITTPTDTDAASINNSNWKYVSRERYDNHPSLLSIVKHRTSRGRLLLHIMLLDTHATHNNYNSSACMMDIVIGCYHPSHSQQNDDNANTSSYRNLWMATRHRHRHRCSNQNNKNKSTHYPIEPFLLQDFDSSNNDPATSSSSSLSSNINNGMTSPIDSASKKDINNSNIRFVSALTLFCLKYKYLHMSTHATKTIFYLCYDADIW